MVFSQKKPGNFKNSDCEVFKMQKIPVFFLVLYCKKILKASFLLRLKTV